MLLSCGSLIHCIVSRSKKTLRFSYNNVIIIAVAVTVHIRNNFVMGEKFTFTSEKLLVALQSNKSNKTPKLPNCLPWNNSVKSYLHFSQSKENTMHLQFNRSPDCSSWPTTTLFTYLPTYLPTLLLIKYPKSHSLSTAQYSKIR